MIILFDFPSSTQIPGSTNNPFDPDEVFKTIFNYITGTLLFIIVPISYKTKTVLLQMEDLKQERTKYDATYK